MRKINTLRDVKRNGSGGEGSTNNGVFATRNEGERERRKRKNGHLERLQRELLARMGYQASYKL